MVKEQTNLVTLRPSREKIQRGQIFRMQIREKYLFGRVIDADLPRERAPMPLANLIYIYKIYSNTAMPDIKILSPDNLLLPPIFTNRLGWTVGVFETIHHQELVSSDLLREHCFWRVATKTYVNEDKIAIPAPKHLDLCGEWGLVSYRWIDDRISDALGIPRVIE